MATMHEGATFEELQQGLRDLWPQVTLRTVTPEERVIVVVSSVSFPVPPHVAPLLPSYEERYLIFVLGLARNANTRVIYVTSQPVLPRLVDYYLDLLPSDVGLRDRLTVVSVGDPSPRPLTAKILERPLLIERLRKLIGTPERAIAIPFVTTELEAELSVRLGVAMYGPNPALAALGSKSGSRAMFAEAGVPHARGASVGSRAELVDALYSLVGEGVRRVAVKLDVGVSGLGNAILDLGGATERLEIADMLGSLRPEDTSLDADAFLDAFDDMGGVVEEWLTGEEVASPSVQLRASPFGEVEVLSTHDQILGGQSGQTYLGCRFPAKPAYARLITNHARAIGHLLAAKGVIGRFGIDFVTVRCGERWDAYAVEINLRNGGTTHPALALLGLTDGTYDEVAAVFTCDGVEKSYVATDHLERPEYARLTPDDVLDVLEREGIGWDPVTKTGVALHLVSAVAVRGMIGVTAIGDDPDQAEAAFARIEVALDAVAGAAPAPRGARM